jgi:hypothetical protein
MGKAGVRREHDRHADRRAGGHQDHDQWLVLEPEVARADPATEATESPHQSVLHDGAGAETKGSRRLRLLLPDRPLN